MGMLPNLKVRPEQLTPYAIVCGDPSRAAAYAEALDGAAEVSHNREYRLFRGNYKGAPLIMASHGVGGPGAAVCFEELIRGGVRYIVRVGTAGSYVRGIGPGSFVVSRAAVREDGLSAQLVNEKFPAVASPVMLQALEAAFAARDVPYHSGITLTLDAFYPGLDNFPHDYYKSAGVLAVEMEIAALYVIGSLRKVHAGAIVVTDGWADDEFASEYNPDRSEVNEAVRRAGTLAMEALFSIYEGKRTAV